VVIKWEGWSEDHGDFGVMAISCPGSDHGGS
jgi:hypothetical protein